MEWWTCERSKNAELYALYTFVFNVSCDSALKIFFNNILIFVKVSISSMTWDPVIIASFTRVSVIEIDDSLIRYYRKYPDNYV